MVKLSGKKECLRFIEMLNLRIDGELSSEDSKVLFSHLSACEECLLYKKRLDAVMTGFSKLGSTEPEIPEKASALLRSAWHEAMKTMDGQTQLSEKAGLTTKPGNDAPSSNVLIFTNIPPTTAFQSFLKVGRISRAAGIAAIFLSTFLLTKTMVLQSGLPDSGKILQEKVVSAIRVPALREPALREPALREPALRETADAKVTRKPTPREQEAVAFAPDRLVQVQDNASRMAEISSEGPGQRHDYDLADIASTPQATLGAAPGFVDSLEEPGEPPIAERLAIPEKFMDAATKDRESKAFAELRGRRPSLTSRAGRNGDAFVIEPAMGTLSPSTGRYEPGAGTYAGQADAGRQAGAAGSTPTMPKPGDREPEMASYLSRETSMPGETGSTADSLSFVILTSNGATTSVDVSEILATAGAVDIRPSEFATSGGQVRTFEARIDAAAVSTLGARFQNLRSARMTLAPKIEAPTQPGSVAVRVTVRETP